jgi:hypothetical protein
MDSFYPTPPRRSSIVILLPAKRTPWRAILLLAFAASPAASFAQTIPVPPVNQSEQLASADAQSPAPLPDAPTPSNQTPGQSTPPAKSTRPLADRIPADIVKAVAPPSQKYIDPGQPAPQSSTADKFKIGIKDAFSPFSGVGWLASAGYSQLINSAPSFGTDSGAFGQRLGAAAVRASTEGILSDCLMSPIFHEDARYYILGPKRNFFVRIVYAGTRTIVTRTDSGHRSPNFGLLAGNLAGAALTNTYYPQTNRSGVQTAKTFAGSIGGSALGFVVSEFYSDLNLLVHPHHK